MGDWERGRACVRGEGTVVNEAHEAEAFVCERERVGECGSVRV